jgi:hypothetical protein
MQILLTLNIYHQIVRYLKFMMTFDMLMLLIFLHALINRLRRLLLLVLTATA